MEPHTLLQRPMNAAQRDKETFIPNVSCAIPKKRAKRELKNEYLCDQYKHQNIKISLVNMELYLDNMNVGHYTLFPLV